MTILDFLPLFAGIGLFLYGMNLLAKAIENLAGAKLEQLLEKDADYTAVLSCGPKPMLKNVAVVAAEYGVPCQVSMEERMACGVGACLGCAIQMADGTMKHVCKDGPVFDAEEVAWNV